MGWLLLHNMTIGVDSTNWIAVFHLCEACFTEINHASRLKRHVVNKVNWDICVVRK